MRTKLEARNALADALDVVKRVLTSHVGSDALPLTEDQFRNLVDARQSLGALISQIEDQMTHPTRHKDRSY